jgi:hypothetical protein
LKQIANVNSQLCERLASARSLVGIQSRRNRGNDAFKEMPGSYAL